MNYFGEADSDRVFVTCHSGQHGQPGQSGIQGKGGVQERSCAHLQLQNCGYDDQIDDGNVDGEMSMKKTTTRNYDEETLMRKR